METVPLHRRAGLSLALAVVFLAPTLVKMSSLVDAGAVRWVEILTLLAGGMASGALLTRGIQAWRG